MGLLDPVGVTITQLEEEVSAQIAVDPLVGVRSLSAVQDLTAAYDYPSFEWLPSHTVGGPNPILDWTDLRNDSITRPNLLPARAWFGSSALDELEFLCSTDHAGGTGNSGLYIASAPDILGPWTWRLDKGTSGRIYQDGGADQTEMPSAYYVGVPPDGYAIFSYVNQVGAGVYQDVKTVQTTDGFTCGSPYVMIGGLPNALPTYGNYVGYFKPFRIGAALYAVHNTGQGGNGVIALAASLDGIQWVSDYQGIGPQSLYLSDQTNTFKIRNIELFQWRGSVWAIVAVGVSTASGGGNQAGAQFYVVQMSRDLRTFVGAPVLLDLPIQDWECKTYCTFTAATDAVYVSGQLVTGPGDRITFDTVGAATGITAGVNYYVKTMSGDGYTLTLSTTLGGATLDITHDGEGTTTPTVPNRAQQVCSLAVGSDLYFCIRVGGQQGRFGLLKLVR
jgi:hypothetical protein